MKIGVVVPCFLDHIPHLFFLLDSIEMQTRKPDHVVVSCSSTLQPVCLPKVFSFPLEIMVTEEGKNAAQNRNIAIERLLEDKNIDYITFMDADDVMHPQRIEMLIQVFENTNADIILHNFIQDSESSLSQMERINDVEMRVNQLMQCSSGCIRHVDFYKYYGQLIHHSQSTVKRWVLDCVKYPEEQEYFGKEDCVFCFRVFSLTNVQTAYIANPLSLYSPSGTQK